MPLFSDTYDPIGKLSEHLESCGLFEVPTLSGISPCKKL